MALRRLPSFLDLNRVSVGIISILLVFALCAGAFAFGALGLDKSTYAMSGVFTDANGISKGSNVLMAGVSIGKVTGVVPDYQSGDVIITWSIDHGVDLGKQTSASLDLENLLGGEYVRLSGPVTRPYLEQLPVSARRIPQSRTKQAFSVNGVLGTSAQDLQAINGTTINTVLGDLTQVLGGAAGDIGPLLSNLGTVSAAVNSREGDLKQLITNTQQVTSTLAAKDQQLGELIDTADGLLQELITRRDQIATVLGTGSSAVQALSTLISTEQANLHQIFGDLHVAVQAAGRQLPEIDQGFAWAGPTFAGLATVGNQGPWFDVVTQSINPDVVGILGQAITGALAGGT